MLYDAAAAEEKRPFPKRVQFTGWFDTGKQGKEWPGNFDIVPEKGYFWRAARSVANPDLGVPWIRLNLRGERPLGETTHLLFRYHLTGADGMRVVLVNRTAKVNHEVELKELKKGTWAEATVDFTTARRADGSPGAPDKASASTRCISSCPRGPSCCWTIFCCMSQGH